MTKTIDIKMTWADALIPLLAVYANASEVGRMNALTDLRRMAAIADLYCDTAVALDNLLSEARQIQGDRENPGLDAAIAKATDQSGRLARLIL